MLIIWSNSLKTYNANFVLYFKIIYHSDSKNSLSQNDWNQYFESLKFKIFKEKILKEMKEQNDKELYRVKIHVTYIHC